MKVGINLPSVNPVATGQFVSEFAQRADERGFASLWVGEHVVLFDEYDSTYPYDPSGKLFLGGTTGMLEPFEVLTFCAGGARCDDYVEVMRRLWTEDVSSYDGDYYHLDPCRQYPKPLQDPHPPLHFGGESDAALRRVARHGDGWHGFNLPPDDAAERVRRLGRLLDERGRRLDDVEVTIGTYFLPVDRAALERYRDAGVDQVVVLDLSTTIDDALRAIDRLAEDLVAPTATW